MAKVSVGTSATALGSTGDVLIQNLGPGVVYVGAGAAVAVATGLEVPVGATLAVGPGAGKLYGIASAASDVRLLAGGLSLSAAAPAS